jgi:hypothetical protein
VNVTFSLFAESVTLHEPVFVAMCLENGTAEPVRVDLGPGRKDHIEFSISDALWIHRTASLYERRGDAAYRLGTLTLPPSTALRRRLVLDEWVKLRKPGRYPIRALLADTLWTADGASLGRAPATDLVLRVCDRDTKRLRSVCQTLLDVLQGSRDFDEREEAAAALGHVTDAVAIPYFEQALSAPHGWAHAVEGLARIANVRALALLRSAASGSESSELRSFARFALRHVSRTPTSRRRPPRT